MSKFGVIFRQVYKKNIKSGTYLFMILLPLIIVAVVGVIGYFIANSNDKPTIAVIGQSEVYRSAILKTKTDDYQIDKQITTVNKAKQALKDEKIDGYLILSTTGSQVSAHYTQRDDSKNFDTDKFQTTLSSMKMGVTAAELSLSPDQVSQLITPAKVTSKTVSYEGDKQVAKNDDQKSINVSIAMGITVLIMIFTTSYAGMIAQEIATEKGSRIMEIILSSVKATTQFFGKICGVLALVLTQLVIYIVVGTIAIFAFKQTDFVQGFLKSVDFSTINFSVIWLALIYFLIGVLCYTMLAAMLGSVVSNVEQVGQAIMPVTLFGMVSYVGGIIAGSDPNNSIFKVASYIPFFSPTIMPVRYAVGSANLTEVTISMLISLLFLVVFTYFASRVYRANVLVYSDAGVLKSLRKSMTLMGSQRN